MPHSAPSHLSTLLGGADWPIGVISNAEASMFSLFPHCSLCLACSCQVLLLVLVSHEYQDEHVLPMGWFPFPHLRNRNYGLKMVPVVSPSLRCHYPGQN